ncbi:nitroreductase [Clostridium sp. DJ247]|uniref:nitroreductase n=1 Tax=Clostridium sp. DJ247 TaxID=2726188 RepID=UPI0016294011|nr:nitroreductase [Clostridium sp. DJ247]MBC2580479.1 nitroreductase family protein [Clostridium sp. DJ247]
MNETLNTLLNRRSIRAYKQDQIKDEDLQTILKAGLFAPSAMNQQSWHFTVIQNEETLHKINEVSRTILQKSGNKNLEERAKSEKFSLFYNAPTLIIVSGSEKAIAPQIDCAVALENMFLAATSLDIGSCWIHGVTSFSNTEEGKALLKELGIPEDYNVIGSGAFGYKATEAPNAAPRKENTVTIIK